jgi:N-acetyl-gamma-glutamyl-phosphate reductase
LKEQIRVGILGAGGFTGQELCRILARHPQAELVYITSSEYAHKALDEAFPFLAHPKFKALKFSPHPQAIAEVPRLDAVFLATPDEVSLRWAPEFLASSVKVIDISGAFRLKSAAAFKEYYGLEQTAATTLSKAVYGLTEIHRAEIRKADLIANPGCYPTAAILPLYVYRDLIDFEKPVIVDAKSGTSGAGGRKEKDGLGYSTVYENFRSYKTAKHQHAPEIAQELSSLSGKGVHLRFTPHLLPLYRGILSSGYAYIRAGKNAGDFAVAASAASNETFLRYRENVDAVEVKHVQHTNFCDYSHYIDGNSGLVQIVSAIDNLVKGAAGQAVQNLNLIFGFAEATGVI